MRPAAHLGGDAGEPEQEEHSRDNPQHVSGEADADKNEGQRQKRKNECHAGAVPDLPRSKRRASTGGKLELLARAVVEAIFPTAGDTKQRSCRRRSRCKARTDVPIGRIDADPNWE